MSDLVTVFETLDALQANFVSSVLEQEGIRSVVRNHETQNLIGYGTFAGYNPLLGAIKVLVNEEDAQQAKSLIEEMELGSSDVALVQDSISDKATGETGTDASSSALSSLRKFRRVFAVYCLLQAPIVYLTLFLRYYGLGIVAFGLTTVIYMGMQYRRYLHDLGYEWVALYDAFWIRLGLGFSAKVPPAAELEVLPGFEQNSLYLVSIVKKMRTHQRTNSDCLP